jgi:CRISPR/Cas system-associated protein Cas7 (RAMP superfamily)
MCKDDNIKTILYISKRNESSLYNTVYKEVGHISPLIKIQTLIEYLIKYNFVKECVRSTFDFSFYNHVEHEAIFENESYLLLFKLKFPDVGVKVIDG